MLMVTMSRSQALFIRSGVAIKDAWLTLDTIGVVSDYAKSRAVGILSIDVDGNDYWFLRKLISIRPSHNYR